MIYLLIVFVFVLWEVATGMLSEMKSYDIKTLRIKVRLSYISIILTVWLYNLMTLGDNYEMLF
jgi:hypothetical protein